MVKPVTAKCMWTTHWSTTQSSLSLIQRSDTSRTSTKFTTRACLADRPVPHITALRGMMNDLTKTSVRDSTKQMRGSWSFRLSQRIIKTTIITSTQVVLIGSSISNGHRYTKSSWMKKVSPTTWINTDSIAQEKTQTSLRSKVEATSHWKINKPPGSSTTTKRSKSFNTRRSNTTLSFCSIPAW